MHTEKENPSSQHFRGLAHSESGAQPSRLLNFSFVVFAGLVGGIISLFFLADSLAALGIPDPGRMTTFGLPFFRAVAWMLMALAIGSFMSSAFLIYPAVPDKDNERLIEAGLTVDGHIAARTGAWAAVGAAVVSLIEVPLVMSDLTGTPLGQVLNPELMGMAVGQIATSQVWLLTAGIAALVAIMGFVARTWAGQVATFFLSLLLTVPLGMEGHSASGGDHDYGTNSLLLHLFFIMLWVGGLMGLIAHGRRLGPDMGVAVRRYSTVALLSIVGLAATGVVNALIRVELGDLFTTRYGLLVLSKTVLTVVLAAIGFVHRRVTIPQLQRAPRLFIRVAVVEVLIMAATVGVAISMGRTPPPPPRDPNLNAMQILVGYELFDAPTATNVWTMFRFDLMFGSLGLVLAGFYLYALWRLKQRGLTWSAVRTTWFLVGSLGLTLILSNGIGLYMPALYSMHMLVHMILSMAIPLCLVLGAPVTLVMEAFEPGGPGKPTLHDAAVALTKSRTLRVLTHPAVNVLQFLAILYVLYLFPSFYEVAISEHAGHVIMNWVFLISGYIYYWEVIGPDPLPWRAPTGVRLLILFVSMPLHLFAGVYLMQMQVILGLDFYESLNLPWNPDFVKDQRTGGGISWGFGQFPLVIVFGSLFRDWLREDRATARRYDAKADVDGDADLERYNAMLKQMGEGDESSFRQH
ncbi:cytochrome c oxidase assembly protein [Corynebacterium aurimucosum]|uniref:cytochrome c oxidase assembly protein n=1 Tax=Corynebacterium aurimucosum TaxID=169292 RepID=UPI00191E16EA|nr:cytochrome c oxidase assembly protein [Corynebacterium aurimucosum]QQU96517.1 bifunctional copper resistance protein CopD/cytochrome c oxidase assembly protein [Corynebacterium aurimucosum]UTA70602.1 bifunctional copper resistance protein CopD/cytochrome c oxidase assembly protein [Corynebacterium aurimucosum]WJY71194.1 Cytochrome c oxidase caa3 assembly factor [Corynebacterium aurimucosum]